MCLCRPFDDPARAVIPLPSRIPQPDHLADHRTAAELVRPGYLDRGFAWARGARGCDLRNRLLHPIDRPEFAEQRPDDP